MNPYDYVPSGYAWSEPARQSAQTASQRPPTSTPRAGGGSLAMSGYDRAEQNRFQTLSLINQRDNTVTRNYSNYALMPSDRPKSARPEDVDAWIRANYGYMAGFLDHPDVGPILREAALAGWDEHRLYGKLSQTDWWRNTSAAQRTWQALKYEDPAEARRQVQEQAATITNRARTLGLKIGNVAGLAEQMVMNGWSDAQMTDAILQQVNWATLEAGDLTALRDDVRATAGDYLVGVSEQTARNYAMRMASGEMSAQGVRSAMAEQAKARFSYIADQIDQGMTVKDYFRPIRDLIARELEVTPEEIDMTDSRWLKMMETRDDKGQLRAATMNEAMLSARKTPEWASTRGAQEMTTRSIQQIAQIFGRRVA